MFNLNFTEKKYYIYDNKLFIQAILTDENNNGIQGEILTLTDTENNTYTRTTDNNGKVLFDLNNISIIGEYTLTYDTITKTININNGNYISKKNILEYINQIKNDYLTNNYPDKEDINYFFFNL